MVKKRRKSKTRKKKEIKFLILVTLICFLLAVVVSFITGRVPVLLDRVIKKSIEGEITKKVEETKKGLSGSDMERLKKEYKK
ncbi:MAG: hypothetical protein AB1401_01630 [Thermodesulfobacteriota bacterium]